MVTLVEQILPRSSFPVSEAWRVALAHVGNIDTPRHSPQAKMVCVCVGVCVGGGVWVYVRGK